MKKILIFICFSAASLITNAQNDIAFSSAAEDTSNNNKSKSIEARLIKMKRKLKHLRKTIIL